MRGTLAVETVGGMAVEHATTGGIPCAAGGMVAEHVTMSLGPLAPPDLVTAYGIVIFRYACIRWLKGRRRAAEEHGLKNFLQAACSVPDCIVIFRQHSLGSGVGQHFFRSILPFLMHLYMLEIGQEIVLSNNTGLDLSCQG